jgi:hypothetical protein
MDPLTRGGQDRSDKSIEEDGKCIGYAFLITGVLLAFIFAVTVVIGVVGRF